MSLTMRLAPLVCVVFGVLAPTDSRSQTPPDSLQCSEPLSRNGAVEGFVSDITGAPVVGALVGAVVEGRGLYCFATSDARGFFRLPRVVRGEHQVIARLGRMWTQSEVAEVVEGRVSSVRLRLRSGPLSVWAPEVPFAQTCYPSAPTGITLAGFVRDSVSGLPVLGALVTAYEGGEVGGRWCGTLTDEHGRYTFHRVWGGLVLVRAEVVGGCLQERAMILATGASARWDADVARCVIYLN